MISSPIVYAMTAYYSYATGTDSTGEPLNDSFRTLRLTECVACLVLSLASGYKCVEIRRDREPGAPTLALYVSMYSRQSVYAFTEVLVGAWLASESHPDGVYRILQVSRASEGRNVVSRGLMSGKK